MQPLRAASQESAVLLKNDGNVLPLRNSDLRSVAIIGPTARQLMVSGGQGERARGFPDRDAVSPLEVLQETAPLARISPTLLESTGSVRWCPPRSLPVA